MKIQLFISCSILLLCITHSISQAGSETVIINEILYHFISNDLEYIELFNLTNESIDLSGWVLKDSNDAHTFRFPTDARIQPSGYLVVTNNLALFGKIYGFPANVGEISFHFSNSGDTVLLFNDSGQLVDSVPYDDSAWPKAADGGGASLERRNPLLPSNLPLSWAASTPPGTPGKPNSSYTDHPAPLLWDVNHSPKIPRPGEKITVTVRVFNLQNTLASVTLHHGKDSGVQYSDVTMLDDGQHQDGSANDGIYGGQIPSAQLGAILRFYLSADDSSGQTTVFPENGNEKPLLTVVENPLPTESVAVLQVVMRPEVQTQFLNRYQTDEFFPATIYDNDQAYYSAEIRHRGRSRSQNSRFKMRFSQSQLFRGKIRRLNLNGADNTSLLNEYLSYQLYEDAGLPSFAVEIVRFLENGKNAGGNAYRVAIENPDAQFLNRRRFFPDDSGNLYKTTLDGTPQNKATWRYIGDDPALYSNCYLKQTNEDAADWNDVIHFCKTLSEANPRDADFVEKVRSVLNPEVLIRWMAVSACIAHWDSPFTDHGQNYVLYDDPSTRQFNILPWDLNGTFEYSSNQEDLNYRKLYTHPRSTKFPAINKILNHPQFGAQYYREIDGLLETLFTQKSMNQRIESARQALKLGLNGVQYLTNYVIVRRNDLALWINKNQGFIFLTTPVYQSTVGEPYLYRTAAVDYRNLKPVTYFLTKAPAWLTVDAHNGVLAGTPPTTGRFEIVLTAKSEAGLQLEQEFSLQVVDPLPRLILNFNETGNSVQDQSSYKHIGALGGDAKRVSGRLGMGIALDGSGDYIRFPHSLDLNLSGAVTVEAWIRPNYISTGNPVIITKGNADTFNYTLMLGYGPFSWDTMEPCFMPHRFDIENRVYYGRKEIEAQLKPNRWAHIAGTYDSATELVCVYYNHQRIVESANRSQMPENPSPLLIGLNGSNGFQGMVDDVKILPFAKQAFAAGLCLSRIDRSGISSGQDRIFFSLSPYRTDEINPADYAVYLMNADRWLRLPDGRLSPGKSLSWYLDDLGLAEPLGRDEIMALYPAAAKGNSSRFFILDEAVWGKAPGLSDPGVQAGAWLPDRVIQLTNESSHTLELRAFADNDDWDQDWTVKPLIAAGPQITSIAVNKGAIQTSSPQVQISLQVIGQPVEMRISESPQFKPDWIPFNSNVPWELSSTIGTKTIYAQVRDRSQERSIVVSATIELMGTRIENWNLHKNE